MCSYRKLYILEMMDIELNINVQELTAIRHYLHAHPELSAQEYNTHLYLLDKLSKLDVDEVISIKTAIIAIFKGKHKGKNVLFRGDFDALPIEETNDMVYRSTVKGVSHKCGHDGHATIQLGLAEYYSKNRPERGDVYLLFQPGEEIGWGARVVVDSGVLEELSIDHVIAMHNLPGFPLHKVLCKSGSFSSSVMTLVARFKGYTAHAAEPWNGRNPAKAMSKYMLEALTYNEERKATKEYVTITPAHTEMGEVAYGTSAGEGSVHLTIRADNNEKMARVVAEIKEHAQRLADDDELTVSFEELEPFEANQNDPKAVKYIKQAAESCGFDYQELDVPFRWGEDFGLITTLYPGAMFGIGAGEGCKPLHHPAYDYPDEITPTTIKMFLAIQKSIQD